MPSLSGALGPLSARALLTMLEANSASGTLFLHQSQSRQGSATPNPNATATSSLVLLRRGKPYLHTDLYTGLGPSAPFDIDQDAAQFDFWAHAETQPLPTAPLRYPDAAGALWALPPLLETPLLSTAEVDLRALIARFAGQRWNGAVVLESSAEQGLLLFREGQLGGAFSSEVQASLGGPSGAAPRTRRGSSALRTLVQLQGPAELTRFTLPKLVAESLLGLVLDQQVAGAAAGGVPDAFDGLELTPGGVRYYRAGTPYLQLTHPHPSPASARPSSGLYTVCHRPPVLILPTEPPGWEQQRYQLTLRGRDALNPMTELAMRFRSDFGPVGQRTLEHFRTELSLEEAAETLGLDLSELRRTVEHLEGESFIRRLS